MAHIDDNNNKRAVSVDINIVPFIDLMSVLIVFLLITAVWTQVSMIQLGSSVYGKKTEQDPAKPPPRAEIPFRLDVKPEGYHVLLGKQMTSIPKKSGQYDADRLRGELKKIKETYPDKIDVVVTVSDEIFYEELIKAMDVALGTGFPEISVATGGVQ